MTKLVLCYYWQILLELIMWLLRLEGSKVPKQTHPPYSKCPGSVTVQFKGRGDLLQASLPVQPVPRVQNPWGLSGVEAACETQASGEEGRELIQIRIRPWKKGLSEVGTFMQPQLWPCHWHGPHPPAVFVALHRPYLHKPSRKTKPFLCFWEPLETELEHFYYYYLWILAFICLLMGWFIAHAGLQLNTLLPQHPLCWDYRCALPHSAAGHYR
jgi:hypothetical protein